MPQIEGVFETLSRRKAVLDANPFLDANDQRGLESAYCLMHNMLGPSHSRQTKSRRSTAQQHLKNMFFIAKALFFVVSPIISITELSKIKHDELFPRLEHWWQKNPPSDDLQSHAENAIEELNTRKDRNSLDIQQRRRMKPNRRNTRAPKAKVQGNAHGRESAEPQNLLNQTTEQELPGPGERSLSSASVHLQPDSQLSTESGMTQNYVMNLLDEETIPFHSSQLINFLGTFQGYPHLQVVYELLKTCDPSLWLPYSLFKLTPPYIRVNLQLPPGISLNFEVSKEFSYRFLEYLWMLQPSVVTGNEASHQDLPENQSGTSVVQGENSTPSSCPGSRR